MTKHRMNFVIPEIIDDRFYSQQVPLCGSFNRWFMLRIWISNTDLPRPMNKTRENSPLFCSLPVSVRFRRMCIAWTKSCKLRLATLSVPYLVIIGITRHRCFETWFRIWFQDPPQVFRNCGRPGPPSTQFLNGETSSVWVRLPVVALSMTSDSGA